MRPLVVIGTRPEAIKMAPVVRAFEAAPDADLTVVSTGQHREMLDQMAASLAIGFDRDLAVMRPGQDLGSLTAALVTGFGDVLRDLSPSIVLVQGDTTSAFACALAAFYQRIPVAHVEAGLRSGRLDNPFPEEANRSLLARIADLHFAPTALAAEHLRAEGIADSRILVTGNTVIDNLLWEVAQERGRSAFDGAAKHRLLVTLHRRENQASVIGAMAGMLRDLASRGDVEVVLPMHLSPAVRSQIAPVLEGVDGVRLIEPLGYEDFVRTLAECSLVVTDSGGVQEEAPSLGKPVLVVRETTERPEGVTAGTSYLVGTEAASVREAIEARLDAAPAAVRANPYGDGLAAERIVARVREFHRGGAGSGSVPDPRSSMDG